MQSMIQAANMSNSFWTDALLHTVYLKNRIPHNTITISPYEKYTGIKPDLSHLRVFGSQVIIKNQGHRPGKLNKHVTIGTFLCFGGNKCNIIFYNNTTHQTQLAHHLEFDETHYHYHYSNCPPYTNRLKNIATAQAEQKYHEIHQPKVNLPYPTAAETAPYDEANKHAAAATLSEPLSQPTLSLFNKLNDNTTLLFKATKQLAGHNLTTITEATIPSHGNHLFDTSITFNCPTNHYSCVTPQSSLALQGFHVGAGVIDADYTGEIKILMYNLTQQPIKINKHQQIAHSLWNKSAMKLTWIPI